VAVPAGCGGDGGNFDAARHPAAIASGRLDFFRKSFVLSTAKARQALDFAPMVPHAVGALTTARWYRDKGLLS